MYVKLIQPKMLRRPMDTDLKARMAPPLGLLTIVNILKDNHKVVLENENIEKINFDDKPDLVGISVMVDVLNRWDAAVSINVANDGELLDLMKEAGCKSLFIGFESINPSSISNVHKVQNNIKNYENAISEMSTASKIF
nr:hypothetical protein [Treponema sp.]